MIILDGVGLNPSKKGNALALASTPVFDSLWKKYPHTKLTAHGDAVGLEKGYIGGSEVGHLHISAGRTVEQELKTINKSIRNKTFFKNEAFLRAIRHVKKHNSRLHLMGLLSDGGVHSEISHLFALLKLAKQHGIYKVYIHAFLDGRDVGQKSASKYLAELEQQIRKNHVGKIATVIGRAYAMDRAGRWDRTKKAYNLLLKGKGESISADAIFTVKKYYKRGFKDEYFPPLVFDKQGAIRSKDAVIDFNFRADRMRQLASAMVNKKFHFFKRLLPNILFVAMAPYSKKIKTLAAFVHPHVRNTLGEVVSRAGLKQLRIAEKEKFVHVTFFSNGDSDVRYPNEARTCIASPRVKTYDLKPAMSAGKVTKHLLKNMSKYDLVIANYANGDMLGHTGKLGAAIKGVEFLDGELGKLIKKIKSLGGEAIILADHGNCDAMIDAKGEQVTNHSKHPVPFIAITDRKIKLRQTGKLGLANVAPTVLQLMRLKVPKEMTARSLIKK